MNDDVNELMRKELDAFEEDVRYIAIEAIRLASIYREVDVVEQLKSKIRSCIQNKKES